MTEIEYGGTLENIKEKLKTYTLEDFSFICEHPQWLINRGLVDKEFLDKFGHCAEILGNFVEFSNAFKIYTDDKKLIEEFKVLFAENKKIKTA